MVKSAYPVPVPPLDFRRDFRGWNIYHDDCTLKLLQVTSVALFAAFDCDAAVNKDSVAFAAFSERCHFYRNKIGNSHDKDAAKWYWYKLRRQLDVLEGLLYGDADANADITLLTCTICKFIIPNPSSQPNIDKCPCCEATNHIVPLPPPAPARATANASTTEPSTTPTSSPTLTNPQTTLPTAKSKTATRTETDDSSTEKPIPARVTRGQAKKKAAKDDAEGQSQGEEEDGIRWG